MAKSGKQREPQAMLPSLKSGETFLTILTLLLLILMFGVAPLHAAGILSTQGLSLVLVCVLVGGVVFISRSLTAVVVMSVAIGLAVAASIHRMIGPSTVDVLLDAGAMVIIGSCLIWLVSRMVFSPGHVGYHRIMGAVLIYLTIAVTFSSLYMFVGLIFPNAFSGLPAFRDQPQLISDLIYYSVVTLTTVGYGDVTPVHPLARSISNLEAIIGQLYPATLLARLVTLHTENR